MPYCRKCGAKLEAEAKFCHVCGTSIDVVASPRFGRTRYARRHRSPVLVSTFMLIAIFLIAFAFIGLFTFFPIRAVNVKESKHVPFNASIQTLSLNLTADIAQINILFENLADKLVVLNVSATGAVGMLAPSNVLNVTFDHTFDGSTLMVDSRVATTYSWAWLSSLKVVCDLYVDPSMNMSLNAKTGIGKVSMNANRSVVFNALRLEATTGGIEVNLTKHAIVNGNISMKTTTGGIEFLWDNAEATINVAAQAKTTTGGIALNIKQNSTIPANVTLNAEASTGGIDFTLAIWDNVGAEIASNTTVGGISVDQNGFSGTDSLLRSDNYPARSNFIIALKTSTGGIDIEADYAAGTIFSR